MTIVFIFFEVLYLSSASGEIRFIKQAYWCLRMVSVCGVRAWVAMLPCNFFYSRSVIVGCSAFRDINQLLERA